MEKKISLLRVLSPVLLSALIFVNMNCHTDSHNMYPLTLTINSGAAGMTMIYRLEKAGIRIDTNCDLDSCRPSTVYERGFSKAESEIVSTRIESFRLDTLNSMYTYTGYFDDGYFIKLEYGNRLLFPKKVLFENVTTKTVDTLFSFIDELITETEFRIGSF